MNGIGIGLIAFSLGLVCGAWFVVANFRVSR